MSNLPYKNPISPIQILGTQSVGRTDTFGTNFSVLGTGGYMEVYNLSDLEYIVPVGQTGTIEYSGNTIPIQFKKGTGSVFSPDVLTLNSDNISSGRRRLGMLVYVYETDKIYQFIIRNYDSLWSGATGATGPGGQTVVVSDFGTTVKNNSVAGQDFINAWTGSTIEGVSGFTSSNATWRILNFSGGTGSVNPTDTFIPVNSGGTFQDSFLNQSGSQLKTTFQNEDIGLNLNFGLSYYGLGDTTQSFLTNSTVELSTVNSSLSAYTFFFLDGGNQEIASGYLGDVKGLRLDFANDEYFFGDFDNSFTGTSFVLSSGTLNKGFSIKNSGNTEGINLDLLTKIYEFGNFTGGNKTKIVINDTSKTISLTNLTSSTDNDLVTIDNSGVLHTFPKSGLTSSGSFLPLSGGTVTGGTVFQSGLTANTISATTYNNLPNTLYTGDGTLNSNRNVTISSNTLTFESTRPSGPAMVVSTIQTSPNNTDTGDVGLSVSYTWTGDSVGNQLVNRVFALSTSHQSTGITLSNMRANNIALNTGPNTNTLEMTAIYIESGQQSGNVNNGRGVFINNSVQGTNQVGFNVNSLGGTNNTGLLLFDSTIPTGNWGIYSSSYNNYFAGKVLIGAATDNGYELDVTGKVRIDNNPNPLLLIGLTANTTDQNLLSIDSGGTVHTFPLSTITGSTQSFVEYLPLSGGTVTGGTVFQSGLTANTISATTYQNLPTYVSAVTEVSNVFTITTNTGSTTLTVDAVTGGTYSNGVITLSGTGNVNGNQITGFSTVTADTFVTGFTINNNLFTISRNQGLSSLTQTLNSLTGLTINGNLSVTGTTSSGIISATTYQNLPTYVSAVTLSSANVLSVTTGNSSVSTTTVNAVTGGTYSNGIITLSGTGTVNGNQITGLSSLTAVTLYSGNGALSGNRVVDIDGFSLNFSGSGATNNLFVSGGSVAVGTTTIPSSSLFTLSSTSKGFLGPRMTEAQRLAISSPTTGLVVYQTDDDEGYYIYKSFGWVQII